LAQLIRLTAAAGSSLRYKVELRNLVSIKAGLAALLLLVGCQPSASEAAEGIDIAPARIVALAPHITELVYAAGAGDRLVGVVEFSNYPVAAQSVPRIGDSFRVDYEIISTLRPDLILAWQSGNPVELVKRLRTLDYRVVELEPHSLDDIATHIVTIGELAGTSVLAAKSAGEFREQLAALQTQYAGAPLVRVFYQIASEPYFTVTDMHVISEAITLCGGQNIFADIPGLAPAVTKEAIIAANPEVIIASVSANNNSWQASWADWESLSAVARNNLYGVDRDLMSRSGPRIVQGIRQICKALADARKKR
jgi:iron complex transport system substrate-binding protein